MVSDFVNSYTPTVHTLIHSCTHTLIYSYTHTLIHSYTHTLIPLIHSYTHTLIIQSVFGMDFHVYTMGWFLEKRAAIASSSLASFTGVSVAELQGSDEFYRIMSQEAEPFDRSLMVKLAMTIKTHILIEGLLNEMDMTPRNKEVFYNASKAYTATECTKGLEILFLWRKPTVSLSRKHTEGHTGYLEVQIGREAVFHITGTVVQWNVV